ncbi:MAG: hypothetical protein ACREBP_05170 [Sphingomicrobium sp.]
MSFILGGLLQGVGAGLATQAAQMREDALLKLRRQYQLEDQASEETRGIAKEERDAKLKVGLLTLADEYRRRQGETEQEHEERLLRIKAELEGKQIGQRGEEERKTVATRAKLDAELERLKSRLDITEAEKKAHGEVSNVHAAEDGTMLVTFKDGSVIRKRAKLRDTRARRADVAEGGEIEEARNRRGGAASGIPKPAVPKPAERVYTPKDLQDTAKARGITVQQAKVLLEELGFGPAK